ncbi:MAG: alpha/beta hydrolase [Frankiales bacterium]|nr:alpha/beta hydrolase [Frankiales bacterium]
MLVTGSGTPVTVVAHGFGASIPESRALASGILGTKLFPQARGHGAAPVPVQPGYGELATDLVAVADAHDATQALGTSMGAHTVLRLLATQPARFARLVLFLPAAIDTPVRRRSELAEALASRERERVLSVVQQEVLPLSGERVAGYAQARTDFLLASAGLPELLEALPDDVPVPDRAVLGAVQADVLVIGQEGDPVHPAAVARELAAALPTARLVVFDEPGAAFLERARLRALISDHLTPG